MNLVRRLRASRRGVAAMEFAFVLPILLTMFVSGVELMNYIIVRMRVSQLALHVADNASRLGEGNVLTERQLREMDINDVLTGAGAQGDNLDIYRRGRIILSSLEASTAFPGRFRIAWQRCRGDRNARRSTFGRAGDDDLPGIGPADQQVRAVAGNPTMFVEIHYEYQPLMLASVVPSVDVVDIASMTVRERRAPGVFPTPGVAPSDVDCAPALVPTP
jgi:hypothetical protein